MYHLYNSTVILNQNTINQNFLSKTRFSATAMTHCQKQFGINLVTHFKVHPSIKVTHSTHFPLHM